MEPRDDVREMIGTRHGLVGKLQDVADDVRAVADGVTRCLRGGGVVYTCGNGGSATQAQHLAAELVGRFKLERAAIRAVCLSDNQAAVTSIANDYSFAEVFARQLDGVAGDRDCLVAVSTSGTSENVVRACRAAHRRGARVFALTGAAGGPVAEASDAVVRVPDTDTPRVQEMHLLVIHVICELVERALAGAPGATPSSRVDVT